MTQSYTFLINASPHENQLIEMHEHLVLGMCETLALPAISLTQLTTVASVTFEEMESSTPPLPATETMEEPTLEMDEVPLEL